MEKVKTKMAKVYDGLANELSKLAHVRFINGLDERPSPPLVEKKMMKSQHWKPLIEEVAIARFIEDEDRKMEGKKKK